ncbi:MAG: phosphate propanoyltransferase [Veillonellales bacterium]
MSDKKIPVGISARHVHVSREDLDILFGSGYELTVKKALSQPGQFASNETVDLVTEKNTFKKVRILGPIRKATQVELALTDGMKLGLKLPVKDSGNHAGTPGITIVGPKGSVDIKQGVIAACRHIHMTPSDAAQHNVKDKEIVQVKFEGDRALIFDKVLIRVSDTCKLDMHIDTDEANACMCKNGDTVEIIK